MPTFGPELVVPNVVYDGPAFLTYSFTGENDDGGITYQADTPLTPGTYAYSFNCLSHPGSPAMPMHVVIAQQYDFYNSTLRGATAPGVFNGAITITQNDIDLYGNALLLSVTGNPTAATARDFSVCKIIP